MTSATPAEPDDDILRLRGWLEEIGELGMALIRKTAPKAAAQIDPPKDAPADTRADAPASPKAPTLNYVAEFTRLCHAVRQAVSLELRLRTAQPARRGAYVRSPAASDPRQAPLRQTLYRAIRTDPDRPRLRRALDERVDAELLDDPDRTVPVGNVLMRICEAFDIHIDLAHLPDEMLPYLEGDGPPPPAGSPPDRFFRSVPR